MLIFVNHARVGTEFQLEKLKRTAMRKLGRDENSNMRNEADGVGLVVMASAWSVFYLVMIVASVTGHLFNSWTELAARY
jgi:hypothetical protein